MATKRRKKKSKLETAVTPQVDVAPATAGRYLAEAVQFGRLLNRCVFFSQQVWIAPSSQARSLARQAWTALELQARKMSETASEAEQLENAVRVPAREFWSILGKPWHHERRNDLVADLSRLDEDEYLAAARDNLFESYVHPAREWRDQLIAAISSILPERLWRAVLLGEQFDLLIRGEQMWRALYQEMATERARHWPRNNSDASASKTPTAAAFSNLWSQSGEPDPRAQSTEEFARGEFPSGSVETWSVQFDESEQSLIRQRLTELGISWDFAQAALLHGIPSEPTGPSENCFVTDNCLDSFINSLRNGSAEQQACSEQPSGYLGLRLEGNRLINAVGVHVSFGRAGELVELAFQLIKAGESGLSREQIMAMKGGVTPNAVDQSKCILNEHLAKIGFNADFLGGSLCLRPLKSFASESEALQKVRPSTGRGS